MEKLEASQKDVKMWLKIGGTLRDHRAGFCGEQ